jgi:hypothetical protein
MRAFNTRIALLAIGTVALVAACGGQSGSKPGTATPTATGHDSHVLAAAASSWSNAKFGGGGYVPGLIYHPTSPNVLYARTDVGGAYRWDQATQAWVPITDFMGVTEGNYHCIESIALDPQNDQNVYMVAGCSGNGKLYVSNDRGATWTTPVNTPDHTLPFIVKGNDAGRGIGERLKVDPQNPAMMWYASRQDGLWGTWDYGKTWYQSTGLTSFRTTSNTIGIEHLMFETGNTGGNQGTYVEYAAVAPDYATAAGLSSTLYVTSNGGGSWQAITVPDAVKGYYIPHMVRAADGYYYITFATSAGPGPAQYGYLYKFGGWSHGNTWTLLKTSSGQGTNDWGGYSGLSVSGTGSTTRIALGISNTWGDFNGQKILQLSDDGGSTWREIASMMPHTDSGEYWGWVDDVEIDPNNRDHIMYGMGGGIWETTNASSATPSWNFKVNGIEETAPLALATPPAGASYKVIDSSGDVGSMVWTDLTQKPTRGPSTGHSNGNSADMAWSDPSYIALIGESNWTGYGYWSGDSGVTWTKMTNVPTGGTNWADASNIVVTARNKAIWAPADSVPSYTTDSGNNWTPTNLPALKQISGNARSYRLAADRVNPNKVYAYDSGGAWWSGEQGKVYVSTDGGHTFTLSQGSLQAGLAPNLFHVTSIAVNPNIEGDIWLADGNYVYHSWDSGATWTKVGNFASVWASGNNSFPSVQGATAVAVGKGATGAWYGATVYVVGVMNGQWGVWQSDDSGWTWTRFNDDAHQFGGIGTIAADQNTYGRIYASGGGRGVLYSN